MGKRIELVAKGVLTPGVSPSGDQKWWAGYYLFHDGCPVPALHTRADARAIVKNGQAYPMFMTMNYLNLQASAGRYAKELPTYTFVVRSRGYSAAATEQLMREIPGVMVTGVAENGQIVGIWRGELALLTRSPYRKFRLSCMGDLLNSLRRRPKLADRTFEVNFCADMRYSKHRVRWLVTRDHMGVWQPEVSEQGASVQASH